MILNNGTEIRCVTQYNNSINFTAGDFVIKGDYIYKVNDDCVQTNVDPELPGSEEFYTLYAKPQSEGIAGLDYLTGVKQFESASEFASFLSLNNASISIVPKELIDAVLNQGGQYRLEDDLYYCLAVYKLVDTVKKLNIVLISYNGKDCIFTNIDSITPINIEYEGTSYSFSLPNLSDVNNPPKRLCYNTLANDAYNLLNKYINLNQYGFSMLYEAPEPAVYKSNSDTQSIGDGDHTGILRVIVEYKLNSSDVRYQETIELHSSSAELDISGKYCNVRLSGNSIKVENNDQVIPSSVSRELRIVSVLYLYKVFPMSIQQLVQDEN